MKGVTVKELEAITGRLSNLTIRPDIPSTTRKEIQAMVHRLYELLDTHEVQVDREKADHRGQDLP